ncbi:MAG: hypothetical protein ACT4QG_06000 [Sporichthyaceae bacterium]
MVGQTGTSEAHSCELAGMTLSELAELLFCSPLQPSQQVDAQAIDAALAESLRAHHGQVAECAEELAASYGKDPEVTCRRMRWARAIVSQRIAG